jgi:hypothetical protein
MNPNLSNYINARMQNFPLIDHNPMFGMTNDHKKRRNSRGNMFFSRPVGSHRVTP